MIIKNKRTKERKILSYIEFQTIFKKELQNALESYIRSENNKPFFRLNKNPETDFYFDLQWNFNHFGNSNWYIERL